MFSTLVDCYRNKLDLGLCEDMLIFAFVVVLCWITADLKPEHLTLFPIVAKLQEMKRLLSVMPMARLAGQTCDLF